jgi:hypothetical protein
VANAIGALQAKVNATVRLEITQMQTGDVTLYYVAHLPNGSLKTDTIDQAIEAARTAAARKAVEEAKRRGATGDLTPVIRTGSAVVKDERSGMDVTMGTVVEAEVIAE